MSSQILKSEKMNNRTWEPVEQGAIDVVLLLMLMRATFVLNALNHIDFNIK